MKKSQKGTTVLITSVAQTISKHPVELDIDDPELEHLTSFVGKPASFVIEPKRVKRDKEDDGYFNNYYWRIVGVPGDDTAPLPKAGAQGGDGATRPSAGHQGAPAAGNGGAYRADPAKVRSYEKTSALQRAVESAQFLASCGQAPEDTTFSDMVAGLYRKYAGLLKEDI